VDFNLAFLPAVTMIDLDLHPLRFRIIEYLLWGGPRAPFTRGRPICQAFRLGTGS
jgi:hypothetical protein